MEDYNLILDDIIPFLEAPLPLEAEIEENEIFPEYLEFKRSYQNRSPHPFLDFCRRQQFISRVLIKAVRSGGARVEAKVLEVYKGEMLKEISFQVSLSWMPSPWFQRGEECFVLLTSLKDLVSETKYHAFGYHDRLQIVRSPEGDYVLGFNGKQNFWTGIEHTVLDWPGYDLVVRLKLEDVLAEIYKAIQT